ncbi:hypothetical protein [Microcystis aeruginosa]|uniref:hypothetical protein n=1 Tax=Microcystis aeruginosa TaxID=1126 RepID=UPI00292D6FA1|nr:hypothetical protein [Microcystis aeruginosa]WOB66389.1 hypothetical protein PJW00_12045 [Microcystis aeruginosa LE3]
MFAPLILYHASGFTVELGHPNPITPAKRPFHTIIPSFLRWDNGNFDGRTDAPQVPR